MVTWEAKMLPAKTWAQKNRLCWRLQVAAKICANMRKAHIRLKMAKAISDVNTVQAHIAERIGDISPKRERFDQGEYAPLAT